MNMEEILEKLNIVQENINLLFHELERLQFENNNYKEAIISHVEKEKNSIPKAKIEDKIKELESTKFGSCVNTIEVLEELLEEE